MSGKTITEEPPPPPAGPPPASPLRVRSAPHFPWLERSGLSRGATLAPGSAPRSPGLVASDDDAGPGQRAFNDLRAKRDGALRNAAAAVRTLLIRLGLTGLTDLSIALDPWGGFVVSGQLPAQDRARLGQALSSHSTFRAAFAIASHAAALVAAGEVLLPFARDYETDPAQAVVHYSWLFESGCSFTLLYRQGAGDFRITSGL